METNAESHVWIQTILIISINTLVLNKSTLCIKKTPVKNYIEKDISIKVLYFWKRSENDRYKIVACLNSYLLVNLVLFFYKIK